MSKVIVGLSGGVDSSVSALLLTQKGYEVEGLFMKNWEEDDTDNYCSAAQDAEDAEAICSKLNIPFHKINFAAEYWDHVFENFLFEYRHGRTPNPDILCNKEIKFKAFLDYALTQGASFIATGHYARIRKTASEKFELLKGSDPNKDQSYFLYTLGQAPLSKTIFPIGELIKTDVRKLAAQIGFKNHAKKDSTGICFIGERKFKDFLNRYLPAQPGKIKNPAGVTLGEHQGLMFYTIGQRQGLGIGGKKNTAELPWYVAQKNLGRNELIVVQDHDHPLLLSKKLICKQASWIDGETPKESFHAHAKIRYRTQDQTCQIQKINNDEYHVTFEKAQWAVTPGQSIVFYQGDVCLGGAIIEGIQE